jgi:hypothetical protein
MPEPLECLENLTGETECSGPVELFPSHAGTGTMIARCHGHQDAADRRAEKMNRDYPDSSFAPAWFDPSYAGESWDEDY